MGTPENSPEMLSEIAALSAKALANTISDEELARGLALLRSERITIKPSKKAKADGDAVLNDLMAL